MLVPAAPAQERFTRYIRTLRYPMAGEQDVVRTGPQRVPIILRAGARGTNPQLHKSWTSIE